MPNRAFGDSISAGHGVPAGQGFVDRIATALGVSVTNHGSNNSMVSDQAALAYQNTIGAGEFATVLIGSNDQRIYGTNATKREFYRRGLQAMIAYLGLPSKQIAQSAGVYTGAWTNNASIYGGAVGKYSNTNGSTATFTLSGSVVYVGITQQRTASGTLDIRIDGDLVGSFGSYTPLPDTVHGKSYGPILLRFPGLSSGAHTVEISVTSATGAPNWVYLDWVAGNDQASFRDVYVGNLPRFTQAAYNSYGGSDEIVAAFNAEIVTAISELVSDGLSVNAIDLTALDPLIDLLLDGVHPSSLGQSKIASAFYHAIRA